MTTIIEAVNAVGGGIHLHSVPGDYDNDFGRELVTSHGGKDERWGRAHLRTRSVSGAATDPGRLDVRAAPHQARAPSTKRASR
ncbi:MAG: hypothetical protein ABIR83_00560 [Nakamurella sp.]